jgi:NADH:ubiquinone oxidoreductase subunit
MAATIGTWLDTKINGKYVGVDDFGNRYYVARGRVKQGLRQRRWVMYNGKSEPSKVPAEWHGWLHHTTDILPQAQGKIRYRWQKPHLPNLTGTKHRYLPEGHAVKGGVRAKSTADYQAWNPGE